jgi:hypothetical protein
MKNALSDIKPDELHACVLITNFLMPYLPSGDKLQHIMHQPPFFLMANDLFRCCGYTHFMVKLVPLTTLHKLLAFKLGAPSLYDMFCSKNDRMKIFDFDGMQIKGRQVATELKDGVLALFFDIDKIISLCAGYSLTFAHNMLVLPGHKTNRVNVYLKNQAPADSSTLFQERRVKKKA